MLCCQDVLGKIPALMTGVITLLCASVVPGFQPLEKMSSHKTMIREACYPLSNTDQYKNFQRTLDKL